MQHALFTVINNDPSALYTNNTHATDMQGEGSLPSFQPRPHADADDQCLLSRLSKRKTKQPTQASILANDDLGGKALQETRQILLAHFHHAVLEAVDPHARVRFGNDILEGRAESVEAEALAAGLIVLVF